MNQFSIHAEYSVCDTDEDARALALDRIEESIFQYASYISQSIYSNISNNDSTNIDTHNINKDKFSKNSSLESLSWDEVFDLPEDDIITSDSKIFSSQNEISFSPHSNSTHSLSSIHNCNSPSYSYDKHSMEDDSQIQITQKNLNSLLLFLIQLEISCPFSDVRKNASNILDKFEKHQFQFIQLPALLSISPSFFISLSKTIGYSPIILNENSKCNTEYIRQLHIDLDNKSKVNKTWRNMRKMFILKNHIISPSSSLNIQLSNTFIQFGRITNLDFLLSYFPSYLEAYKISTSDILLTRSSGPLPSTYRIYIAIMAAAEMRCQYLISLLSHEFLMINGNKNWLKGISYAPQKIQRITILNSLLAHQPWKISSNHISQLTQRIESFPIMNVGESSWTVPEIFQMIIILSSFHASSALALSLGAVPDFDVVSEFEGINLDNNLSSFELFTSNGYSKSDTSDSNIISRSNSNPTSVEKDKANIKYNPSNSSFNTSPISMLNNGKDIKNKTNLDYKNKNISFVSDYNLINSEYSEESFSFLYENSEADIYSTCNNDPKLCFKSQSQYKSQSPEFKSKLKENDFLNKSESNIISKDVISSFENNLKITNEISSSYISTFSKSLTNSLSVDTYHDFVEGTSNNSDNGDQKMSKSKMLNQFGSSKRISNVNNLDKKIQANDLSNNFNHFSNIPKGYFINDKDNHEDNKIPINDEHLLLDILSNSFMKYLCNVNDQVIWQDFDSINNCSICSSFNDDYVLNHWQKKESVSQYSEDNLNNFSTQDDLKNDVDNFNLKILRSYNQHLKYHKNKERIYDILYLNEFNWEKDVIILISQFLDNVDKSLDKRFNNSSRINPLESINLLEDEMDIDNNNNNNSSSTSNENNYNNLINLRDGTWCYTLRIFGMLKDNYDYKRISTCLHPTVKSFLKKMASYPCDISIKDWDSIKYIENNNENNNKDSNRSMGLKDKIMISIVASDARLQASLCYGARAIQLFMIS